jgi:carboxyl-terminal processing protease
VLHHHTPFHPYARRALRAFLPGLCLGLVVAACTAKAPASGESRRATPDVQAAPAAPGQGAPAAPTPPPDPREAALSEAMVKLLQREHLLRKPIDDALSRTAFATYVDRLDGGKMFLLARHREALTKYDDKIDDELRAGSLELAHEGSQIFVARVEVVAKVVAELLAAPFNHDDEEWVELDPKKIELAATEQELRDRWRRRLELEVLERVGQMEARLQAAAERDAKNAGKPGDKADKNAARAPGKANGGKANGGKANDGKANDGKANDKTNAKASAPKAGDKGGDAKSGDKGGNAKAGNAKAGDAKAGDAKAAPDDDDGDEVATPLDKIPPTPEARDAKVRADLAKTYAARFTRLRHPGPFDAASDLVNAVTSSLDPHTNYLPPADKANFDLRMTGSLEGIGALLRERDDYVEVSEIVPGGASWRHGGLSAGDLIMAVSEEGKEPVDTFDMRLDDVVKMIRGPKGTIVHLRIQKATGTQQTIAITRDIIVIEDTYARGAVLMRKGQPSYGYIHLPSFYGGRGAGQRTASTDVRKLLGEMKGRKLAGAILDIRSNGGGLLGDAIELTGAFIDRGPVVQVQDNRGRRETLSDDQRGVDFDGPVIVMVDRFSASASEILAGALQDYKRAIIVGTGPTHGKGTVQTLADLDRATGGKIDLGVLKITVQQFFRVTGASTQREGVMPDVVLPDPAGHLETGERELEHAIPWSAVPAVPHDTWNATWKTPTLVERSAVRIAKHPSFTKMAALTQLLRSTRDDTRLPLARAAWEARRKERRAAIEAASPDLRNAAPGLVVKALDESAPPPPPGPDGKTDDRPSRWRDNLARDPWVEECVNILGDMTAK